MENETEESFSVILKSLTEKAETVKSSLNVKKLIDLPKDELESKVFFPGLQLCSATFLELLETVVSVLNVNPRPNEVIDWIALILKTSLDMLQNINHLLIEVNKIELKKIDYGCSIPKNIACILLKAFQHCQTSERIYGKLFTSMGELLTMLFRKAYEVQSNFFIFLSETILFNCGLQNELDLLVEVMDLLAQIGEVLIDLDIKTLATQWKGYMQLTDSYVQDIKVWLDVSKPLRFLAKHIVKTLQKISAVVNCDVVSNEEYGKHLIKDLKIGNFLLKIIVKLCELYSDHLGECHRELLYLLIDLNGFSACYLHNYRLPNGVVDYIDRNITIAAGPLLSQLYQDNCFISEFNKLVLTYPGLSADCSQSSFTKRGEKIGFILLTIAVMKKVSNSDYNPQQRWLIIEKSLVQVILDAVLYSGVELNMDVKINRVEIPGASDLYEYIFTHTAAFIIATISEESFVKIEKMLVRKVLQPHFWTALLASDLFCLLARFGNNELRLSQAQYFSKLIINWSKDDRTRPEYVYAVRLASRLIKMLSIQEAQFLFHQHPSLFSIDIGLTGILCDDIDFETVCGSVSRFASAGNNERISSFNCMVEKLDKIAFFKTVNEEVCLKLSSVLVKLWTSCADILDKTKSDLWINNLIMTLSVVTGVLLQKMETDALHKIMAALLNIVTNCSTFSKLSLLKFLKTLASKEIKCTGKHVNVFKQVAQLFGRLINDSDVFVNFIALDTFKYFAAFTKHVQIISFTAQTDHSVEQSLKAYLQGTFAPNENIIPMEFDDYLEKLDDIKFNHKSVKSLDKSLSVLNVDNRLKKSVSGESLIENNLILSNSVENEKNCQKYSANEDNKTEVEEIFTLLEELNSVINEFVSKNNAVDKKNFSAILNELRSCVASCRNVNQLK